MSDYYKYWKDRVERAIDGTKVPSNLNMKKYLNYLNISKNDNVLDLGCGFGRFFEVLYEKSNFIHGLDIDSAMIKDARKYDYVSVKKGTTENIPYAENFFNFCISIGVFDIVNQENSLLEANRILKNGGKLLFTGKNINYSIEDELALTAEKKCIEKSFSLTFTDVLSLKECLSDYGFRLTKEIYFKKRGDFGNQEETNDNIFYEFILILEKISNPAYGTKPIFTSNISSTLMTAQIKSGLDMDKFILNYKE